MMIIFSTVLSDLNGTLAVKEIEGTTLQERQRRVSRVKTLDGGATVTDFGYSDGDRTFNITYPTGRYADEARARYLVELSAEMYCSTYDGLYRGVISAYTVEGQQATITFLPTTKVAN